MEILNIKAAEKTPQVIFDNEGILYIGGRSVHEKPDEFYEEIIEFIGKTKEGYTLDVTFDYEYFNTAAAKMIFKLMGKIEEMKGNITWMFEYGDDDMEEAGEDYDSMIKDINFKLVEKPE